MVKPDWVASSLFGASEFHKAGVKLWLFLFSVHNDYIELYLCLKNMTNILNVPKVFNLDLYNHRN